LSQLLHRKIDKYYIMIDPQLIELSQNAPWFLVSAALFFTIFKVSKWVIAKMNDVHNILFNKKDGKIIQLLETQQDFVQSVKQNNEQIRGDIMVALESIKNIEKKISYMNTVGFENINSDYFNVLFEQTPIPIMFLNDDMEIMRANEKCCDILGYNYDEITSINVVDITDSRDTQIDLLQADKIRTGELESYRLEKSFIRKNKELMYCTVFMYRIPSEGPFNHFIKIIIPLDRVFLS